MYSQSSPIPIRASKMEPPGSKIWWLFLELVKALAQNESDFFELKKFHFPITSPTEQLR